ncbi:DHHC palmitoyltransferase-domain-containing protein [Fimicolochytrium jonesii]|uniref:DHHC palmitoyltransferase-domain-containing protein n=1 Tax=Fimicolochytrium jonesii TaxID=1396493 RepID=UPI0022FDBD54|nr:DHHC palmitoyltransferase-domain-containing protein [Fimicolochytrium jonesii]KAI8823715.1 DHHC palmitoyltransferase-domain-containing protein [Fimicolochytrium jonesii]
MNWGRVFVVGVILLIAFVPITTQYFIFVPWLTFHPERSLYLWLGTFNLGAASIIVNYLLGVFTDAGRVPKDYEPPKPSAEGSKGLMKPRWCKTCKVFKPPRSHHCSVCNRCVLLMDHHCPWLNNCIGHRNQAYFLRFVVSVTLTAINCLVLMALRIWDIYSYQKQFEKAPYTADFYTPPPEGPEVVFMMTNLIILFLLLVTVGILSLYQLHYTASNVTTIESFEKSKIEELTRQGKISPDDVIPYPYDLGTYRNFQRVLGPHWYLWWLPLPAYGDGIHHPVNDAAQRTKEETGLPLQWPPKAYFIHRRFPHGRPSRREREEEKRRDREMGYSRRNHVRRGSEGYLVRPWTAEEREEEVRRALERDRWMANNKPLVQLDVKLPVVRPHEEQEEEEESEPESVESTDSDSTDWSFESYSGTESSSQQDQDDDGDEDEDAPLAKEFTPTHVRHRRKPASGRRRQREPEEYVDDGAVDAGCTGDVHPVGKPVAH